MREDFLGHYVKWREKRLKAITNYYGPEFFIGKTMLEMGCGRAHIGKYFYDLGSIVTVCDGRKQHVDYVKENNPELISFVMDLELDFPEEFFDIIVDMGLIYHLTDYKFHLNKVCSFCDWLILETEVKDSNIIDDNLIRSDNTLMYDQSLHGKGIRPSIAGIEHILKEHGMSFYRIDDDRCNSSNHNYNWIPANTGRSDVGLRKMWFCKKG